MTLLYTSGKWVEGQSTDTKPSTLPLGWKFRELDTGKRYMWDGAQWIYLDTSKEAKNKFSLSPKTSLVQLFGDTFAKTAASSIFLLEGNGNDLQGGTALTNVGTPIYSTSKFLGLRGYQVWDNSANSDVTGFKMNTEAKVEVGTGSFIAGAWLVRDNHTPTTVDIIFNYGDESANEQNWYVRMDTDGKWQTVIDDGTNTTNIKDSIPFRYCDGKTPFFIMMFLDKNTDTLYLLGGTGPQDVSILASGDTSSVTGTLDNVGTTLGVGIRGATNSQAFEGFMSNAFLYKMTSGSEDYNLPAILAAGIRESAVTGSRTNTTDTTQRFNNSTDIANADGNYLTTTINTDEGYYDIIYGYWKNTNKGIAKIDIDGITRLTQDHYAASLTVNQKQIVRGVFLSEGFHRLKWKIDGKNGSSSAFGVGSNFIFLVKRDGSQEGGATSFTLFGDEINQRNQNFNFTVQTDRVFNNLTQNQTSPADGDFIQGDLYVKRGLYRMILTYTQTTTFGLANFDANNVEILDQFDLGGTFTPNAQITRFVRLNGGKTTFKWESKNDGGGNITTGFSSIRFELVSGTGYGDRQTIRYADADNETVAGTEIPIIVNTSSRFNGIRYAGGAGANDGDHIVWRRYFYGGVYRVKFLGNKGTDRGIYDIYSDSNSASPNIFNQLDWYNSPVTFNDEVFALVNLTRGFHDIHLLVNGKNASSTDFAVSMNMIDFELIGHTTQLGDAQDKDNEDGNRVLLGIKTFRKAETSFTFNFADITFEKYSKIEVLVKGRTDGAENIEAVINGLTGNYFQDGWKIDTSGTLVVDDINSGTNLLLIANSAARAHSCTLTIEFAQRASGTTFDYFGKIDAGNDDVRARGSRWVEVNNSVSKLNTLQILASANNLDTNNLIQIWGYRRT